MPIGQTFATEGLQPAYFGPLTPPPLALGGVLPYGGQQGSGAPFTQGTLLGVISTTAANEVRTLALNGGTGTITVTLTFDTGVVQYSFAHNAALADVLAATVAAIPSWGNGNLAVTGTPGTSYVFTFQKQLGNAAFGGKWVAVASAGTTSGPAWARTTAGSTVCQWDAYDSVTNNRVDGVLRYDTTTSPSGARAGSDFGVATNQTATQTIFVTGWFNPADLHLANGSAVDSNAYSVGLTAKLGAAPNNVYAALLS